MNAVLLASLVGVVCFAAGVVFGKSVVSEAESIKTHVSAEVAKLRGELAAKIRG